ncbi:MAG: hypothetical protein K0M55_12010 [Rhizobium sp.]|nr:hypothetical protein [Rhizobium sp.]
MFEFNCGQFSGAIVEISSFKLLLELHRRGTGASFTANGIRDVRDSVQYIVELAEKLGLAGTQEHGTHALVILDRADAQIGGKIRLQKQVVALESDEVNDLRLFFGNLVPFINSEFKRKKLLEISDVRLGFWNKADSYGLDFASVLPDAVPDIQEAARCLALERYTASAFHSVRSLEFGLEYLCSRVNVTPKNPNWENVLNDLNSAVNNWANSGRPNWKQEQQAYSELTAHLRACKNAWRNYVMHRHAMYDYVQADAIFRASTMFLSDLAGAP